MLATRLLQQGVRKWHSLAPLSLPRHELTHCGMLLWLRWGSHAKQLAWLSSKKEGGRGKKSQVAQPANHESRSQESSTQREGKELLGGSLGEGERGFYFGTPVNRGKSVTSVWSVLAARAAIWTNDSISPPSYNWQSGVSVHLPRCLYSGLLITDTARPPAPTQKVFYSILKHTSLRVTHSLTHSTLEER